MEKQEACFVMTVICERTWIIAAFLVWLLAAHAAPAAAADNTVARLPMTEVIPRLTEDALINPGMGLYLACGGQIRPIEGDEWYLKIANIAYYRMGWSTVEPEEGADLNDYFGPIFDHWVTTHGGRVAIRVMAESTHNREKYVTPKWVFDKGVPGVEHIGLRGNEQIDPVFWDERYLDEACAFAKRLGRYLDGRAGLEFVDIGLIGEWGEMHLGLHIPNRWTGEQLEQTGYTEEKYIAAYRRVIDAFAEAFPRTQVFLNVGGYQSINEYAAIKGIHFRQDGLTPSGPSHNVGEVLYVPWARRGIKGNYEFHSGLASMRQKGWDLHATIEEGLEAPISYLNTNILSVGALAKADDEVRRELTYAARRVGYRFVIERLNYQNRFHVSSDRSGRILVEHAWKNVGVAPCYDSYALRFSLIDAAGKPAAEFVHYPRIPTTDWWPGRTVDLRAVVRTPPGLAPGEYTLKVAMIHPEKPGRNILIGISGRDANDRYDVGRITAVAAQGGGGTVYEQKFDENMGRWKAAKGMVASIDRTAARESAGCLLLEGGQEGGWSFAAVSPRSAVLPACKYQLTCYMRVDALEPATEPPNLKLGVADPSGKHLINHNTNRYDMKRVGEWQRLVAVFETLPESAQGQISVEKGGRHAVRRAKIRLDDVRLDLLESP